MNKSTKPQPVRAGKTGSERIQRKSVGQLVEELRECLRRLAPALGTKFLSIHEICAEFGVSPVTSQKALKCLEQEGLLNNIKGSGSYVRALPVLPHGAERRIGLSFLLPGGNRDEVDVAFRQFGDLAAQELRASGRLVQNLTRSELQDAPLAKQELADLDALVMSFGCYDSLTAPTLVAWGRPVVVIQHEDIMDFPFHQVVPDLLPGCRLAAQELIRAGTTEVFVINNRDSTHSFRNRKFAQVVGELFPDVAVRELLVDPIACDLGRIAGRQLGEKLLSYGRPVVAFSPSDLLSFGVLDALDAHGAELGRDVRLVSYDNLEGDGLLPFGKALLTSIVNPREKVARAAARMALHVLQQPDDGLRVLRVPTGLVRRVSSGT